MKDLIQVVFMILDHTLSSFEELKELRVPQGKVVQKKLKHVDALTHF